MNTKFLAIILSLFLFSCNSKKKEIASPKKSSVKMELQSIEKHFYTTTSENLIIQELVETDFYSQGQKEMTLNSEKLYFYDKANKLVETQEFNIHGESKILNEKIKYNENITEKLGYRNKDTVRYVKDTFLNGKRIQTLHKIKFLTGDEINELIKYKYNNDGNLIRKDIYDLKGKLVKFFDYEISKIQNGIKIENKDLKGNLIQVERKYYTDDILDLEVWEVPDMEIDSFIYSNGNLVREVSINMHFGEQRITNLKYNTKGLLEESKYYLSEE